MLSFINKYKRWIYFALFIFVFIIMFFPPKTYEGLKINSSVTNLFSYLDGKYIDTVSEYAHSEAEIQFHKMRVVKSIAGSTLIIVGVITNILTVIFANKRYKSYSLGFMLISTACIIKIFVTTNGISRIQGGKFIFTPTHYGDAWSDYVIISIALLMLIVDIVRLSIYIRNHREQIAAKLSALKPPPRERKPSKDERIAELEERVRQLEDSKKDG